MLCQEFWCVSGKRTRHAPKPSRLSTWDTVSGGSVCVSWGWAFFIFQFHSTFIPFPVRFYSLSFPFLVSCRISIFMNAINNAKRQSLRELKSIDSWAGSDWKSRWISIMHFWESRYNSAVCNMYIWLHLYSGWAWMYQSLFTWPSRHGMPLKFKNKSVMQQHE